MRNDTGKRIEDSFPSVWNLLNRKARERLPRGLEEYLSDEYAEEGWQCLEQVDRNFTKLAEYLSEEEIGSAFRRDLSGVGDVKKVTELFCELATALSFAVFSSPSIKLRPKNKNGKACDFAVKIGELCLSVEVKRYEDKNQFERYPSSVCDGLAAEVEDKPRSMEIRSKLRAIPEQIPVTGLSMITVFHSSVGDSAKYIQKALFGDQACSLDRNEAASEDCVLYEDGLFATSAFDTVSCVAKCRISDMGLAQVVLLWRNPNAKFSMDDKTRALVSGIGK